MNHDFPSRVCHRELAHARFGDTADRLMHALGRCDPLADAVAADFATLGTARGRALLDNAIAHGIDAVPDAPSSLRALFDQLERRPPWVDLSALDRAGELMFRTGFIGGTVLGTKSLVTGYCSPGGNKPLVFSGQLRRRDRIGYRLAETGRFVTDVCRPGGLRREGQGFAATVRVRMMHATVRRLLLASGRFYPERWGAPINQHDMAGTILLFSLAFIDGVRAFGFRVTPDETHGFLQLWRYCGHLIGVEPSLLPTDEATGRQMADCIALTQGEPDDDARSLVRALIEPPPSTALNHSIVTRTATRYRVAAAYGITRALMGDAMADKLELPHTSLRFVVPMMRTLIGGIERVGQHHTSYRTRCIAAGQRYWQHATTTATTGPRVPFRAPVELEGLGGHA